jgi:1-aminocyclopropane-1-carboxylate deaminase/D-cysteine desulfhydrase-like pyridoxal-dependent ACC family enzyme
MLIEQNEWMFFVVRTAVLALALLMFAWAFGRWRRSGRVDMQQVFAQLDESRGETRALSQLAQQLAAQITALQSCIEDRQQLAVASAGGAQRGYDLALQMARNGASPDEIVSACGVTRHEAGLLTRLHNPVRP